MNPYARRFIPRLPHLFLPLLYHRIAHGPIVDIGIADRVPLHPAILAGASACYIDRTNVKGSIGHRGEGGDRRAHGRLKSLTHVWD
jgi:hypothetical protein